MTVTAAIAARGAVPAASTDATAASVARAGQATVFDLFRASVDQKPGAVAISEHGSATTYRELGERVDQIAAMLLGRGLRRGSVVAVLSENRREYIELMLAAAQLGAVVACLNVRSALPELAAAVSLSTAVLGFASEQHADRLFEAGPGLRAVLRFGRAFEAEIEAAPNLRVPDGVDAEDVLLLLYTSGTTGFAKAAAISQRAFVWRSIVSIADGVMFPDRAFICWAPLFHMAGADNALGLLMHGGRLIMMPGFDARRMVDILVEEEVGLLSLMPSTVTKLVEELEREPRPIKGVRIVGSMPDLIPGAQIAAVTGLLRAPFRNSFGSTEGGPAPASRGRLAPGTVPKSLDKVQSSFCDVRLVDVKGEAVPDGEPGEVLVRAPTLFSGYWGAAELNREILADGWFRTGDLMRRNPDGTLSFIDRTKYLIKSGGENVYPAEIERVLIADPRIVEAVVVRKADERWSEVPAVFVVAADTSLTSDDVLDLCRAQLAGYKVPKAVVFIEDGDLPRSTTGKIKRQELEKRLNA